MNDYCGYLNNTSWTLPARCIRKVCILPKRYRNQIGLQPIQYCQIYYANNTHGGVGFIFIGTLNPHYRKEDINWRKNDITEVLPLKRRHAQKWIGAVGETSRDEKRERMKERLGEREREIYRKREMNKYLEITTRFPSRMRIRSEPIRHSHVLSVQHNNRYQLIQLLWLWKGKLTSVGSYCYNRRHFSLHGNVNSRTSRMHSLKAGQTKFATIKVVWFLRTPHSTMSNQLLSWLFDSSGYFFKKCISSRSKRPVYTLSQA